MPNNIRTGFVLNGLRAWLEEQDDFDGYDPVFGKITTQQVRNKISELERVSKLIPEEESNA